MDSHYRIGTSVIILSRKFWVSMDVTLSWEIPDKTTEEKILFQNIVKMLPIVSSEEYP